MMPKAARVLLTLALAACGPPMAVRTPSGEVPAGPPSAVDVEALVARDGLFRDLQSPSVGQVLDVELDGAAPPELVIRVDSYSGEGTWANHWHVYRQTASGPVRIGDPLEGGGYMDPGWTAAVALDGGPRQSLVVVGDTEGVAPSDLHVWELDGDRLVDRVHGADPGVEVVPFDHDGDGDLELVAFAAEPGDPPTARSVVLQRGAASRFREVAPHAPPATWLPRLLDALLVTRGPQRLDHLLPLVIGVMKGEGARPMHPAATQAALEARFATEGEDRLALVRTMVWADAPGLVPFLRARLTAEAPEGEGRDDFAWASWRSEALAAVLSRGTPEDRAWAVARARRVASAPGGDVSEVAAAVEVTETLGLDPVLPFVLRLVDQKTTSAERRMNLVREVVTAHPNGARALLRWTTGTNLLLAEEAAEALADQLAPWTPDAAAWAVALKAADFLPLLRSPHAALRVHGAVAIKHLEDPAAGPAVLERLDAEHDPRALMRLVDAAHALGLAADPRILERHLATLDDHAARRAIHWYLAHDGRPETSLAGLRHARGADELEVYAIGREKRGLHPGGPEWAGFVDALEPFLGAPNARTRALAIALLGYEPDLDRSGPVIILALSDREEAVRVAALRALARHPNPSLARTLGEASNGLYGRGAPVAVGIEELGRLGGPLAQAHLERVLDTEPGGEGTSGNAIPALAAVLAHDPARFAGRLRARLAHASNRRAPRCYDLTLLGKWLAWSERADDDFRAVLAHPACLAPSARTDAVWSYLVFLEEHGGPPHVALVERYTENADREVRVLALRAKRALQAK